MRPEEAEEMDAMGEKIGSLQCRLARAQKERDAARTLIAELVTALEACTEWMGDNVPSDGWGCRDRRADADRIETLKTANAALDKAKAVTP